MFPKRFILAFLHVVNPIEVFDVCSSQRSDREARNVYESVMLASFKRCAAIAFAKVSDNSASVVTVYLRVVQRNSVLFRWPWFNRATLAVM